MRQVPLQRNCVQADELVNVAKDYNRALVVPEINSPALISHLGRRYDNVYRRDVIAILPL